MGLWISILLLLIVVVLWQVYTQIEAFSSRGSNEYVPRDCPSARDEYLRANDDVRAAGVDPWNHWNQYGKNEGRVWPRCTDAPSFTPAPATATAAEPIDASGASIPSTTAPATATATTTTTAPATATATTAATAPATTTTAPATPATTATATTAPATAATTAAAATTMDASGVSIPSTQQAMRSFSPEEIVAALSGVKLRDTTARNEAAPVKSPEMTKEMEERLAKRITSQLRSELLSQRATEPIDNKYAPCELSPSDAEAQGAEYTQAKPGFNINDYIRKDSIPCWACSLPPA